MAHVKTTIEWCRHAMLPCLPSTSMPCPCLPVLLPSSSSLSPYECPNTCWRERECTMHEPCLQWGAAFSSSLMALPVLLLERGDVNGENAGGKEGMGWVRCACCHQPHQLQVNRTHVPRWGRMVRSDERAGTRRRGERRRRARCRRVAMRVRSVQLIIRRPPR